MCVCYFFALEVSSFFSLSPIPLLGNQGPRKTNQGTPLSAASRFSVLLSCFPGLTAWPGVHFRSRIRRAQAGIDGLCGPPTHFTETSSLPNQTSGSLGLERKSAKKEDAGSEQEKENWGKTARMAGKSLRRTYSRMQFRCSIFTKYDIRSVVFMPASIG